MKPKKARRCIALVAVQPYQKILLWSMHKTRKGVIRAMEDNHWPRHEYRIARVEIREISK